MSDELGSSLLTGGSPVQDGNPQAPAPNSAEAAVQSVQDGPPEYLPAKFWDANTKSPKIEDLGKSYQNLEKLLGREKVPVPSSDDDEEGWQRWYAASGRPEDPDKYEFKRPELPKDLPYDEDTEKAFKTWAHVNGLNKRQAANLYDGYVKTQLERHAHYQTGQKQARAKVEMDLRREYGGQYEGTMTGARNAMNQYADPDFRAWLDESGMGNDPRLIRVFARIGKEVGGDSKLKGAAPQQANTQDLDAAIRDYRTKHEVALFKRDHPDHDARTAEYNRLFQMRFPQT